MAEFFTCQIFIECLLCAKQYSKSRPTVVNKAAKNHGTYILVGETIKENIEYVRWGNVLKSKSEAEKGDTQYWEWNYR